MKERRLKASFFCYFCLYQPPMHKKKLLVIETESTLLRVLEFKLRKDGFEVVTASDGREGANKIANEQPDLIITNLILPFVTGLEIVNMAKQNRSIPVILLTNVDYEQTLMEAFDLGANDFIIKPFSPNELTIRVKKLLRKN